MQGQINLEYYQNNNCFNDIKLAVEQLMTATESQFEAIKKEKWYNRLWDMVTFSSKKDIRLAEQISSLSKAQQLFMEILVRVSEKDVKVAELILNNSDSINKLSENDVYLLTHIKRLERICLGITTINDPGDLSAEEAKLLSAFMYILSYKNSNPNDYQKVYFKNLSDHLKAEGITTDENKVYIQIEEGSEQLKEIALRCAYEYLILGDRELALTEEQQEIIDQLDIGKRTTQRIICEVSMSLHSRGCEGIANKYYNEPFEEISPFFDLGIEETEESEPSSDISQEYSGLPLKFVEDKKVFKSIISFETKDYFMMATQLSWCCYDKKTNSDKEITSINSGDIQVFRSDWNRGNKKYVVDYENNTVFYIKDDILHRFDIENDTCKSYKNTLCNNKISYLQMYKNYIAMSSDDYLYCFDIESESIFEVTDTIGKSIGNTKDTISVLNDNIYFYSRSGSALCSDDGGSLTNTIAMYDIKNKSISRVQSADVKKIFVAFGEIYVIAAQDNDYDNLYLFKLVEQEGKYVFETLIKFPYAEIVLSENYLLYYPNSESFCTSEDLYSIYAFDFRNKECKKIVEDCHLYKDDGIIKSKYVKKVSNFKVFGNWLYYIKDHLVFQMRGPTTFESHIYRTNINLPLQPVDLGEKSKY